MDAIIRFLQDTGFYLFSQDGNWRCLIMLGIACVLLYLGIVKKFEPLLLVPIAFGMLITNLPGANMFHEIFFAGVSAVPMAARVSQMVGQKYNPGNFLLMHAMGPNVAGVIGSAIAAGVLISLYG